jgi:hypothetical protein
MFPTAGKLSLGVLVAALTGAVMLAGASSAMAKMVKSDSISFSGPYNAAGEWTSTKCKLTSDGEFVPGTTKLRVFPCTVFGYAPSIGNEVTYANSSWSSEDGRGEVESYFLRTKSEPPKETYTGGAECEEQEEEEGKLVQYLCEPKVKLVFNTLKKTVTGKYVIYEQSTQP